MSSKQRATRHALAIVLATFVLGALPLAWADDPAGAPRNIIHYDIKGKRFELSDHVLVQGGFDPFKPSPTLVVFGAHWCDPCKDLMKLVAKHRADLDGAGVTLVYVHVDDVDRSEGLDSSEIKKKAAEMGSKDDFKGVRVLLGGDMDEVRSWMDDPDMNALPGAVMLTKTGEVVARTKLSGFEDALARFLENVKPAQ